MDFIFKIVDMSIQKFNAFWYVFFCLPLIKMFKNAVSIWLEKTDELIQEGKLMYMKLRH